MIRRGVSVIPVIAVLAVVGCQEPQADRRFEDPATGKPVIIQPDYRDRPGRERPPQRPSIRSDGLSKLDEARLRYLADPTSEDAIIWYGRRTAYTGAYHDAIRIYTNGLLYHPDSYKLLRHRGHRFISVREPDRAIADLGRAADLILDVPDEVEPDGLPNRLNIPTSTSHTNIYYHLALAHYLKGDYELAAEAWRHCLSFSKNNDMRCAAAYWRYLALRRLGLDDEAAALLEPITAGMEIIENTSYHQLLLVFKGVRTPETMVREASPVGEAVDDATVAYGLAMHALLAGDHGAARAQMHRLVDSSDARTAFGYLAAEADLARERYVER